MCHQGPALLERDLLSLLEETVLIGRLSVRARETQVVSNVLLCRLQIAQLVHVVLYI